MKRDCSTCRTRYVCEEQAEFLCKQRDYCDYSPDSTTVKPYPLDESGCDDFKDHYRAGYDFIMALQGELVAQHHTESGCLDYKVVKALAATYELQDYLANRIAQAMADGELEPDPED